jgi:uncharacterized protein (TIGR00730 family)
MIPDFGHTGDDAWRLFRIISEFVEGFETLSAMGPSVSIFGSARLRHNSPYYHMAIEVAYKIAKKGFSIITGAGLSIMEAANKGAQKAQGRSCGLVIDLPFETEPNEFIDPKLKLKFRYFFVRKVMFVRYAQGFVFLPGGYGTLDEMFETITLIQTRKIQPVPVYLIGTEFWKGLIDWLEDTMLSGKCIDSSDLNLFTVTDDLDEVAEGLERAYHNRLKLKEPEI